MTLPTNSSLSAPNTSSSKPRVALAILNPVAGQGLVAEAEAALADAFAGWQIAIHRTTPDDDLRRVVTSATLPPGALVIAAGGDGAVAQVADALMGRDLVLGILPCGTANVLALELGIPGDPRQAAALLANQHAERRLDAMRIGDRCFVLQVGVGLDSLMIRDTDRAAKRSLGRLAYMITLARKLRQLRPRRYTIVADGERLRPRANQVLVANAGTLGARPLRWAPNIEPDDGRLDLCIWRSWSPRDLLRWLPWPTRRRSPIISSRPIHDSVSITADRPLPVQADGEIIGDTPVRVTLIPSAVRVIVPPTRERQSVG